MPAKQNHISIKGKVVINSLDTDKIVFSQNQRVDRGAELPKAPEQKPAQLTYNIAGLASFAEFKSPVGPHEDAEYSNLEMKKSKEYFSLQRPTPSTQTPHTHPRLIDRKENTQLSRFSSSKIGATHEIDDFPGSN